MRNFKNLRVWQKSHHLVLYVYSITKTFPKEELYGLVSQIRRSATSIPSNISEGCGRSSEAELARFMTIASGSAAELEYQLLLSKDLLLISLADYERLNASLTEIRKMLNSFIQKLR
ncbi:four helix bundle protein [Dyadobacter aurulentus]|uniref:four helix bundle protein n=1 Tax=Dyadobacter sp. UC 10 TaxID=2605428 RepID=UPI0011F2C7BB|nr:four helix bundle protein [Dyadobacter sp. UC 10]KAA0989612.1 four helix bundle protein [Dyadobacter sp. UC 10]